MAHFPIKNENSSCEVFLFCKNKVPNQFPEIVMKYAYGSGNLNLEVRGVRPYREAPLDCRVRHGIQHHTCQER